MRFCSGPRVLRSLLPLWAAAHPQGARASVMVMSHPGHVLCSSIPRYATACDCHPVVSAEMPQHVGPGSRKPCGGFWFRDDLAAVIQEASEQCRGNHGTASLGPESRIQNTPCPLAPFLSLPLVHSGTSGKSLHLLSNEDNRPARHCRAPGHVQVLVLLASELYL